MPSYKTDNLVELINSLSKSEKRHFKLFSNRSGNSVKLYVRLFAQLEKDGNYDESRVLAKIPELKKAQLSNLKANLYKQILRSLRDINKADYVEIKAREQFDFAKVLYSKGQYRASIEMLEKVKALAAETHDQPLEYMAVNFEKQIEAQHVTGSMSAKAFQLSEHSSRILDSLQLTNALSNLSLSLYGIYLQRGYVRNQKDYDYLRNYLEARLPDVILSELDFYQKLHYHQLHVWYYHMMQDFGRYYKHAQRWADLFTEYPDMLKQKTTLYIKGLHNVLNALFMSGKLERFDENIQRLTDLLHHPGLALSRNEASQLNLFRYTHIINRIFLTADYDKGTEALVELEQKIDRRDHRWDLNRILVFRYKIACVYFGRGDLGKAIHYLNQITNRSYPNFKEDIQCFARILNLIAHFDLGNDLLVRYQIKSVYRFLLKMKELQSVQKEIFAFIRRTPSIPKSETIAEFSKLKRKLQSLEGQRFEKRPFLYLDIISWLDSKIDGVSMVEAIRGRRTSRT